MTNINQTIDEPFEIVASVGLQEIVTNTQSPLSENNEICRENCSGAKQEDPSLTIQQNQRCVKKQYKVQKYCIQETCTL